MTEPTPPLHPLEREQLLNESTLTITVHSTAERETQPEAATEEPSETDLSPTLSFQSYDALMTTLTPRVLELIETVRNEEPASINETARISDRDVKNVHEELSQLAQLGIIFFESDGQRKRPVVWFDELVINLPFQTPDEGDSRTVSA